MSYQIELRHYRYFLAVADELHFRKAAEKLFISQPGLSRQIKQLEEALELELFERHNRKVVLTPSGQFLQEQLKKCLNNLDHIQAHARLLAQGLEGRLRIGYIGSAMQNVIPDFLVKIRSAKPNLSFDLRAMDNPIQVNALIANDIDLGFVRMDRIPKPLKMRRVFQDTFSLVLPENHPIKQESYKSLSQFKEEGFILFDKQYSQSYYEKVMQIFDYSGFLPHISHQTVEANTIYRLVENGFGISIVPTALRQGYNIPVQFIELKNIPVRTNLQMVWNEENPNPVLESILSLLNENEQ